MVIRLSEFHRRLCVSFSRTAVGLCIYHLFVWSNWNFLHNSQWITLPTQVCLVLYSFCANLLHSLIMWLIVSSLLPLNLHLLFCCVLFILALIWLVLMPFFFFFFFAAIRIDSVFLLRFLFPRHVQIFSFEMLLISRLKRPDSCFSFNFCFLVFVVPLVLVSFELFLVAVTSLSSRFSMLYLSRCIDASTPSSKLANLLSPSFLDAYNLSTSFLGCNVLCMVISFFVLWSICLSSSLVHFNNSPEYLTRGTALVFIPSIRFLPHSFVSSSFLIFLVIL